MFDLDSAVVALALLVGVTVALKLAFPLPGSRKAGGAARRSCAACGARTAAFAKFCPQCGARLEGGIQRDRRAS